MKKPFRLAAYFVFALFVISASGALVAFPKGLPKYMRVTLPQEEPVSSSIKFNIPFKYGNKTYSSIDQLPSSTAQYLFREVKNYTISAGVPVNFTAIITIPKMDTEKQSIGSPFGLKVWNSIDTTVGSPQYGQVNPGITMEWYMNDSAYEVYEGSQLLNLTNSDLLTVSFLLPVYSDASPSSPQYFGYFTIPIINSTPIDVQSYEALQVEKQNLILQNDALSSEVNTEFTNGLVFALTLVIVAVALLDVGLGLLDRQDKEDEKNNRGNSDSSGRYRYGIRIFFGKYEFQWNRREKDSE